MLYCAWHEGTGVSKSAFERYTHNWRGIRCTACKTMLHKSGRNVNELCPARAPDTDYGTVAFIERITRRGRWNQDVPTKPREKRPMPYIASTLAEAESLQKR